MSIRMRELIRAVRACKTAAEERDVIAKESAALREAFREQDPRYRHRNIAKLMYIHMLGYPTHFGQMETLKLIAANGFPEKRIGYLGLMLLLDERQEVLMLVTNSLKLDLNNSRNQYICGLALAALGNICSAEMARDLAPDVERLLGQPNPYLRKKAALCAIRVLKKNPELLEEFAEAAPTLLSDKAHGVALGGVSLMLAICALDPNGPTIARYRQHVPALCAMLRGLLQAGFSPEYDVGGITDPYLQVKVLRLLRVLGAGSPEASDAMTDILAQVAAGVEGGRNAGWAILYEAVATIMGIDSLGGLRVMGVNILGRFLAARDNNIRCVALNMLAQVVAVDTQAVQRHRATIVECVKDADVSIRRRALELVYALVNEGNIRTLTRELLDYLAVCDSEFKPDLTAKIASLITRYAPDKRWQLDSLLCVLVQAGSHVKEGVVHGLIARISNADEALQAYAARRLAAALADGLRGKGGGSGGGVRGGSSSGGGGLLLEGIGDDDAAAAAASGGGAAAGAAAGAGVSGGAGGSVRASPALLFAAAWVLGEYGELLPTGAAGAPQHQLLEGEPPLALTEAGVVDLLEALLSARSPRPPPGVLEVALTAAAKLTTRLPSQAGRLAGLVARHKGSVLLEVQARCCEYSQLLAAHGSISGQLLERMPAIEEDAAAGGGGLGGGVGSPSARQQPAAAAPAGGGAAAAAAAGDDLVDLLGGLDAASAAVGRVSGSSGGGAAAAGGGLGGGLDDLLGGPLSAAPAPQAAAAAAPPADILDLLGGGAPSGPSSVGVGGAAAAAAQLDDLLLGAAAAPPAAAPGAAGGSSSSMVVFDQDGLRITFDVTPPPVPGGPTTIASTACNTGLDDLTDFNLQAAVPKYLALRLDPASGSALPGLGGAVTQALHVTNSLAGAKPLALRLRISFTRGGQPVTHQAEVSHFPAGL